MKSENLRQTRTFNVSTYFEQKSQKVGKIAFSGSYMQFVAEKEMGALPRLFNSQHRMPAACFKYVKCLKKDMMACYIFVNNTDY